jgi:hypothetical protein
LALALFVLLAAANLAGRAPSASAQAPSTYNIPITYALAANYFRTSTLGLYGCGFYCGLGSYGSYPYSYGYNAWPYFGGYNGYWPGYYGTTAVINYAVRPGASSPLWLYCTGSNGTPVWVNLATSSTAGLFC